MFPENSDIETTAEGDLAQENSNEPVIPESEEPGCFMDLYSEGVLSASRQAEIKAEQEKYRNVNPSV